MTNKLPSPIVRRYILFLSYKVFTQSSDSYFCFRTNLTPMAISGSATSTTNRTSALEPRHVGSPAYRRWGTDRSASWRWGADMSAPQHIGVGAPTGRLAGVGEQTCRLPSKLSLGSRQVGCLAFGSRPVGSPANCRWGADRSVPQNIAVGGPTYRLPRG